MSSRKVLPWEYEIRDGSVPVDVNYPRIIINEFYLAYWVSKNIDATFKDFVFHKNPEFWTVFKRQKIQQYQVFLHVSGWREQLYCLLVHVRHVLSQVPQPHLVLLPSKAVSIAMYHHTGAFFPLESYCFELMFLPKVVKLKMERKGSVF